MTTYRLRVFSFRNLIWLLALVLLNGCSTPTVSTSKRIQSDLVSTEYGETKTEYVKRPTFVSMDTLSNGTNALRITLNVYGRHMRSVFFYDEERDVLVDAVETFLEWEQSAAKKRDILKKRITTVKHSNTPEIYLSFYSENETDHYLTIGYLDPGMRGGTEFPFLVFDRENAKKFKNLLLQIPDSGHR